MAPTTTEVEVIDLTGSSPTKNRSRNQTDSDLVVEAGPSSGGSSSKKKVKKSKKRRRDEAAQEDDSSIEFVGEFIEALDLSKTRASSPIYVSSPPEKKQKKRKHRTNGERTPEGPTTSQRRLRSLEPHQRPTSPKGGDAALTLFFVDVKPAAVVVDIDDVMEQLASAPSAAISGAAETKAHATEELDAHHRPLLLPAHVTVLESIAGAAEPVEILPPAEPYSDEETYIEFLDYDGGKAPGIVRYFDEEGAEKVTKLICKRCGAEGEHKTALCPVMICLTCGARDEHSTRSCPISKTCYSCGMKGHMIQACPSRHSSRRGVLDRNDDCARCDSRRHKTNECPTLWRIYEYVDDDQRLAVLQMREGMNNLKVGSGGEGYIARDEWCYNCGDNGHLGDDCPAARFDSMPGDSSAFGSVNAMSGPFFDPEAKTALPMSRGPRDWESDALPPDWGHNAPANVGQQGRKKERAKLARQVEEQEPEDDPEDWFGSTRNARNRGMPPARGGKAGKDDQGKKKITFGFQPRDEPFQNPGPSNRSSGSGPRVESSSGRGDRGDGHSSRSRRNVDELEIRGASKKSLSDRLSDPRDYDSRGSGGRRGDRDRDRQRNRGDSDRDRERDRGRDRRDADRDRGHHSDRHRPHYSGGYSR